MNNFENNISWLSAAPAYTTRKSEGDKVIIFDRANCIFVFNFHSSKVIYFLFFKNKPNLVVLGLPIRRSRSRKVLPCVGL